MATFGDEHPARGFVDPVVDDKGSHDARVHDEIGLDLDRELRGDEPIERRAHLRIGETGGRRQFLRARRLDGGSGMAETSGRATVTVPVTGGSHGWPFGRPLTDLERYGYCEAE